MTNLEALRLLPAEQMAEFLTEQRMKVAEVILEDADVQVVEDLRSQVKTILQDWLLKEATP